MATVRLTNVKANGFFEVDENGNQLYKSDAVIIASSSYPNAPTFSAYSNYRPDFSDDGFLPETFKLIMLTPSCFLTAEQRHRYQIKRVGSVKLYLNTLYPFANYTENTRNDLLYAKVIQTDLGNYARKKLRWTSTESPSNVGQSVKYQGYKYMYESDGTYWIGVAPMYNTPASLSNVYDVIWRETATAEFDGIGTSNAPYITYLELVECDPELIVLPGDGAFVDDSADIKIKWDIVLNTSDDGSTFPITELSFLFGTDTNTENVIPLAASDTSITIPAGTFPSQGIVYWRLRYKSDAREEYLYTDLATYTTVDSIPTVVAATPVNISISGKIDNVFVWNYQIDTSSSQKAFDLQISNNAGATWTDVFSHCETSETQAIIPAGSLTSGKRKWRVRSYNTDDIASEWSDIADVIVREAPPLPPVIVDVAHKPRVVISWQSTDQQAYRVTANGYDSGVVFGTGKTFVIPYYFADGETVAVSAQIKNSFGEWSEKTNVTVQVSNVSPGTITMTASAENAGIVLNWTAEGTFAKYYLLRDGEPIARTEETGYTDYFSVGESRYQVMGVDADGYYALSEEITLAPVLENGVISGVDPVDWIPLAVKRGNQPEFVSSHTESITYQYYSGRMLPVPYSSRFREVTRTLDFTVKLPAYRRLKELVGEIVIYKDYTGEKMIGVLNDLQTSGRPDRPDINASITAIDYSEVIPFD